MGASLFEKNIVKNMTRKELLDTIEERQDLYEIVNTFRVSEDYKVREYLTIQEFSKYFKCGVTYANQVAQFGAKTGKYYSIKQGKAWKIDRISYEKYMMEKGLVPIQV